MYSYEGYIQQNTVNVARKKNNLLFAMAANQIQQFRLNSYGC